MRKHEKRALREIVAELHRAQKKFKSFASAHEGYAVLLEECDELWDEVKHPIGKHSKRRMHAEAVQVAAMALRFIVEVCE